jgi:hypothetical protein
MKYLLYTYGVFLIWAGWRLQSWAETYDWHGILCIFLGLILLINKLYRWMGDTPSHGRRITVAVGYTLIVLYTIQKVILVMPSDY